MKELKLNDLKKAIKTTKLEDRFEMVNPAVVIDPTKQKGCTVNTTITVGLA